MTEFEAATLALQQAQLWAAVAIPVVAGLVGAGQCGLIWYGIRQMGAAGTAREKREDARHVEAMRALDSQAEAFRGQGEALRAVVQGLEQQGETLRAVVQGLEQQGETLRAVVQGMEKQGQALEALIERTGAPA